jgi:hypothetical protein
VSSDEPPKGTIEQAIETLVYAPIGLFFEGPSLLPKLVEQGKTHARNARFFGKFAVQHGQAELRRRLGEFEQQAGDVLRGLGITPDGQRATAPSAGGPRSRAAASGTGPGAGRGGSRAAGGGDGVAGARAVPADGGGDADADADGDGETGGGPNVGDLAITDYDSLAASQVVSRLAGLTGDELESVRAYEIAHRGRKTILNKVAQLQA